MGATTVESPSHSAPINEILPVEDVQSTVPTKHTISKSWTPIRQHKPTYAGGKTMLTADGAFLVCMLGDDINFLEIATGQLVKTLTVSEDDPVSTFLLSPNNKVIFTAHARSNSIKSWSVETGFEIKSWKGHDLPITDMAMDPTNTLLATSSVDRSVRVWDAEGGFCTHNFTNHSSMVVRVFFHPNPARLQLYSTCDNGRMKTWYLKDSKSVELQSHLSVVTSLSFTQDGSKMISSGRDNVFSIWDVDTNKCISTVPLYESIEGLFILPTNTVFPGSPNSSTPAADCLETDTFFVTAGDKGKIRYWNMRTKRCVYEYSHATVSGFDESSQTALRLANGEHKKSEYPSHIAMSYLLMFHPQLMSRTFDSIDIKSTEEITNTKKESIYSKIMGFDKDSDENQEKPFFPLAKPCIIAITGDNNFLFYDIATMKCKKTFVGYNDEIVDAKLIPNSTLAIVATNSSQPRVFNIEDMSADLMNGHSDVVLAVDVSSCGRFIVTSSKDLTVRLWMVNPPRAKSGKYLDKRSIICIAIGKGHTEAIGAVQLCRKLPNYDQVEEDLKMNYNSLTYFAVSGSRDRTLKYWNLAPFLALSDPRYLELIESHDGAGYPTRIVQMGSNDVDISDALINPIQLTAQTTVVAHEKDINAISIAPNDFYIATGSQDKTIKIWAGHTLKTVATMRGHKRGLWSLAFSPVDKALISTSSDHTLKLWSITDFSCIKTFEGHSTSVLKASFIKSGTQILSSDADGMVKLWNVRTSECVNSFDSSHEDRIWGLSVSRSDKIMVTGGADSTITVWEDTTEEERLENDRAESEKTLREQQLLNSLRKKEYERSFDLALQLAQPRRLFQVVLEIIDVENRYKRWKHLNRKRQAAKILKKQSRMKIHEEHNARRVAMGLKSVEYVDEESSDEEEWLIAEARENLELNVPKPGTNLRTLIKDRSLEELKLLVRFLQEWNTNAKFAPAAQAILECILLHISPEILKKIPDIKEAILSLNVYSQRHFNRIDTLLQNSYLIEYVFQSMNLLLPALDDTLENDTIDEESSLEKLHNSNVLQKKSGKDFMMDVLDLNLDESDLEDEYISSDEEVEEVEDIQSDEDDMDMEDMDMEDMDMDMEDMDMEDIDMEGLDSDIDMGDISDDSDVEEPIITKKTKKIVTTKHEAKKTKLNVKNKEIDVEVQINQVLKQLERKKPTGKGESKILHVVESESDSDTEMNPEDTAFWNSASQNWS